jgi:hypothetical protein
MRMKAGEGRQKDAQAAGLVVSALAELWLERYKSGQSAEVWAEMRDLGPEIRTARFWHHASAVATETMARVSKNIDTVAARLKATGYWFAEPPSIRRQPASETAVLLDVFEARHGPMPLSLRAFYDVAGTVNLTQSNGQLVHYWPEERRRRATELEILGEYDPLVVQPLTDPMTWPGVPGVAWFFACDEFQKANYSGGANYHVLLPDADADFRIYGMADNREFFVDYLRFTFEGGGFRGQSDANEERSWKVLPGLHVTNRLAEGLLPI